MIIISLSFRRHDLAALPANTSNPLLFDDSTKESTFSSEQFPRYYRTSRTSQVSSTDGHHASISAPSTGIDASREESTTNKTYTGRGNASTVEGSVEEVSSAIANACMLLECNKELLYTYI